MKTIKGSPAGGLPTGKMSFRRRLGSAVTPVKEAARRKSFKERAVGFGKWIVALPRNLCRGLVRLVWRILCWFGHALISSWRFVKYLLIVLLTYLLQVTFVPMINIAGVTPNICFTLIAVVTVCNGRLRAYWTGTIFGILFGVMLPSVSSMNMILYPVASLFCSVFYADMNEARLEEKRAINPNAHNRNQFWRTVWCAVSINTMYEIVHLVYIYLTGTPMTAGHFVRSLITVVMTFVITAVFVNPLRRYFGYPARWPWNTRPRKEKKHERSKAANAFTIS